MPMFFFFSSSVCPLFSTVTIITLTCTHTLDRHTRRFLTNTRVHTWHLRFLPFSIFECSGIIILVCVWDWERERERDAYGLPVSYKYQAVFPGNPRPCLSAVYTAEQHVQKKKKPKKKKPLFVFSSFLLSCPHFKSFHFVFVRFFAYLLSHYSALFILAKEGPHRCFYCSSVISSVINLVLSHPSCTILITCLFLPKFKSSRVWLTWIFYSLLSAHLYFPLSLPPSFSTHLLQ